MEIQTSRLATITTLYSGKHDPNGKMCVMEAVAYVAGEKWSDSPECVCPVIAAFARNWNDALNDEDRNRLLLPMIPKFIGTRGSEALANRRATMAADWMVRVHMPTWLRLAGLTEHVDALAGLPEIVDFARTPALMPVLRAAGKDAAAAWDAARAAVGASISLDAAREAALAAAWDAARAAALAGTSLDVARAAALAAATWDAAWAAALDKLLPTVKVLQDSALVLLNRMIDARGDGLVNVDEG